MPRIPSTIHYSSLRYEDISHRVRGGSAPRVWFLEQESSLWHLYKSILSDLIYILGIAAKWLKINYRKEFLVGFILLIALMPTPKKVAAVAPPVSAPAYIQPIAKITPVVAVQFVAPQEAAPVAPPPPPPPPAPVYVAPKPVRVAPVYIAPISGCGDNFYANYIYMHESGCVPTRVNSIGCLGIGQSCSPAVLRAACPSLDYGCENAFFTHYANSRYGGWAGSYSFWLAHKWW